jgi:hypothetical protein
MTAGRRANRKDTDPATEYAVRAYREFGLLYRARDAE